MSMARFPLTFTTGLRWETTLSFFSVKRGLLGLEDRFNDVVELNLIRERQRGRFRDFLDVLQNGNDFFNLSLDGVIKIVPVIGVAKMLDIEHLALEL